MGTDTEPGMVIGPGQRLGAPAVRQQEPADRIHLPQLHRRPAFPAFHLRSRGMTSLGQLGHQPPRTQIGRASRTSTDATSTPADI